MPPGWWLCARCANGPESVRYAAEQGTESSKSSGCGGQTGSKRRSTTNNRRRERISATEVTKIPASAWVFVSSFVVGITLVITANIWIYSMLEEVNRRLSKEAQISELWIRWNMYKILGLHAEMYPKSPKRWQMWTLSLSGFALMFGGFLASPLFHFR
jgi:hypothetical protein